MLIRVFALLCLLVAGARGQTVLSFTDIQYWVGTGTNSAALMLQWNDAGTPTSLAWGYHWNGTATGQGMLTAIAGATAIQNPDGSPASPISSLSGADTHLSLTITQYSFGDAVFALVYNPPGGGATRTQADWNSGFWEYLVFGGTFDYFDFNTSSNATYNVAGSSSYADVAWFSSPIGASDRQLVNGSWDAWSFAPGFSNVPVEQAVSAVPEPSTWVLLGLAATLLFLKRRKDVTGRLQSH